MSEWYPIVHGRTAFVDFRSNLIVVPEIFDERELEWAKKHILSTTRLPDRLPENPRWSVFQNPKLVVAGVTCMAGEVSREMTHEIEVVDGRERERRPLYVFLGYAALQPVSGLPPRDLELFAPLYRFVKERWREQWHDSREIHRSRKPVALPVAPAGPALPLNRRDEVLFVLPHSSADQLWTAAASFDGASLCIGMPNPAEALAGVFHNVTVQGREEQGAYRREPEQRRPELRPRPRPDPYDDDRRGPPPPPRSTREGSLPLLDSILRILSSLIEATREGLFGSGEFFRDDREDRDRERRGDHYGGLRQGGPGPGRDAFRRPAHPSRERPRAPKCVGDARPPDPPGGGQAGPSVPSGFVRSRSEGPLPGSTWDGWAEKPDSPELAGPKPDEPKSAPPRAAE